MMYTIKAGDTLSKIANKYGCTVAEIKAKNSIIKDVNKIQAGWTIEIPTKQTVITYTKDYASIGKQLEICLKEIEKLDSVKKLMGMM